MDFLTWIFGGAVLIAAVIAGINFFYERKLENLVEELRKELDV